MTKLSSKRCKQRGIYLKRLKPHTSVQFSYETLSWLVGLALEKAAPLPHLNDLNSFKKITERYSSRDDLTEQESIRETGYSLEVRLLAVIKYYRHLASKNHL